MIKKSSPIFNRISHNANSRIMYLFIVLFLLASFNSFSQADLSITKIVEDGTPGQPFTPDVGGTVVFIITVTNSSAIDATGVRVQDVLPSGYGDITNINNNGASLGNNINWNNLTVPANSSIELRVSATVLPTGEYNNRAQITASDQPDPDSDPSSGFDDDDLNDGQADDDESNTVVVQPLKADLAITKEVEFLDRNLVSGRPHQGTQAVFTITVTNNGPSATENVLVTDLLPAGFLYVSDDSAGDYNSSTGAWTIGDMTSNGVATLAITTIITIEEDYTNTATIDISSSYDSNEGNNTASVTVNPVKFFIPQAFSPDGDGVNDTFEMPGLGVLYPDFNMEIYNRWGNKVYEYSNNGNASPEWWDGYSKGNLTLSKNKKLPTGTYFYILHLNKDNLSPISNWVYLNR